MQKYKVPQLVFILAPFVFSFAFGLDIYIPIIPQMTQIFNTTPASIQLTLSLFLFTMGIGQLIIGPLSDRFGRLAIFYSGSFLYALAALGCAISTNIIWLIFARICSAIGACGMLVTASAVVRDLFSKKESAKMYSLLNGAIGISPTFAPILGGYLYLYFGWQSIFFFLAALGFFSIIITQIYIKETHEACKRVPIDRTILLRYFQIFTNRQFLIYSFLAGFAESIFFCFFSISPFIIIDLLGIPTHEFGYFFAMFGCVIAFGGIASSKVVEKMGLQRTIAIGIILMFIGGGSMLVWHYLSSLTLQGFLIPMIIACTGAMFLVGTAASAALEPFGSIPGTAAAAFGCIEFSVSSLIGSFLMLFPIHSTIPYGISILLMGLFSLTLFRISSGLDEEAKVEVASN